MENGLEKGNVAPFTRGEVIIFDASKMRPTAPRSVEVSPAQIAVGSISPEQAIVNKLHTMAQVGSPPVEVEARISIPSPALPSIKTHTSRGSIIKKVFLPPNIYESASWLSVFKARKGKKSAAAMVAA